MPSIYCGLMPKMESILNTFIYMKISTEYFPFVRKEEYKRHLEPGSSKIQDPCMVAHTVPAVCINYTTP